MLRRIKKAVAALCCVMLIFSALSGCSDSRPKNGQQNNSGNSASAGTGETEPVALSFFGGGIDRINKENNVVIQEIEKRTNTKLQVTILTPSDYLDKYNLLVASGDTPDISRLPGYDYYQYIPQGIFLDMTDLLDQYGENMKKYIPQEAWDLVTVNNKHYAIPNYNWPGKYNFYIRQDWLDNLGLKVPTNLDELRDALKKFTYDDPDKNGKNDTYGISVQEEFNDVNIGFMNIFGAFGVMPYQYYVKDGKVYSPFITPEYKAAIEYITTLYMEDKVVDPDIFIEKTDQARMNLAQGKSGTFNGWWAIPEQVLIDQMKMKQIDPDVKWTIADGITGSNGQCGLFSNGSDNGTCSISTKCKDPVAAIKLLDFLTSDEGAYLASLGIEGVHYTKKSDGGFDKRTPEGNKAMDEKWLDAMSLAIIRVDISMDIYKQNNPTYWPYIEAARDAKLYSNVFEGITTPEAQKYLADLKKMQLEWFVKFVTGKEPISKFDEYVQQWNDKGGREVFNSYIKEYNARTGKNLTAGN